MPQESGKKEERAPEPEDPPSNITLDTIKNSWQNIIDNLGKVKMSVATYLNEGELVKLERNILTVAFAKNYSLHKETLEKKENKEIIEKNICGLLNANLRVNFILTTEEKQKDTSENHPFIKTALEMFDGRVIKED
jgi:DNA polymerase-3 subunit gamma/tau